MENAEGATAEQRQRNVAQHFSGLVVKYPANDEQRQALHGVLLADVASAEAWARVLRYEVGCFSRACSCVALGILQQLECRQLAPSHCSLRSV